MNKSLKDRARHFWKEWLRPLLVIVVLVTSVRSVVADWNHVPTGSMKPTIIEGDRIFVNKLAYDLKVPFTSIRVARWDAPERGDIVVFFSPDTGIRMVKRVIGLPGDNIAIRDNQLFVNGVPVQYEDVAIQPDDARQKMLEEHLPGAPHAVLFSPLKPSVRDFTPFIVPEKSYFVMGDNRDNSFDSRFFGVVPESKIVGKAVGVAMSNDPDRLIGFRWNRLFQGLD